MINVLAEACTKRCGNSDGGVINSSCEGSGKVTEKSLHLEGDRKFSVGCRWKGLSRQMGKPNQNQGE